MKNIEERRESSNVVEKRGLMTHKNIEEMTDDEYIDFINKAHKVRDKVRNYVPGANDQWDEHVAGRVADEQWKKHHDTKGYPLESYEIDYLKEERARDAAQDAPDTTARQDNTRVNPRIARRRSLDGKDLGEYRMR